MALMIENIQKYYHYNLRNMFLHAYQTISVLTTFSKTHEVIYNRLNHHMHTENILAPE